jgi:RsiW-degrading membrane proteinase PrsW (M82 family)
MLALLFYSKIDLETYLGASAAGIIEESAKILIVALMMGKAGRYRWILNGLLLGAAIGTGFAAFESAGYAFDIMLKSSVEEGAGNILSRGMLAPFGHIVWTANAAAALWLVKVNKPFKWEMLQAGPFLRIFIAVVAMHMIWNAPFALVPIPLFLDLKYVLLGLLAWVICFRLIQAGLKQLSEARQQELRQIV